MSKEKFNKKHTKQAIKNRGEVFTPEHLVEEMLSKVPRDYFTSAEKTMLDNSCGNGNFLVKILEWRIKNGISQLESLKTIYGIELDENNAKECKERLSLGSKDAEIWKILNHNIICANTLDPNHKGWEKVGYMWEGKNPESAFFDFS
jgi:adenine-specific DNA-methyltransferase